MNKEKTLNKIAVVIATKNRPKLLQQRALQSVLKQSLQPDLIIVVDDSDDEFQNNNKTIVESLSLTKGQIHYMPNRRTKGASGAWNTATAFLLEHYNQDNQLFLAFLDDDDEWLPLYLAQCFSTAIKTHSNMVCSGFFRHEPNNDKPIRVIPPKIISEDLFLRGNPGIQASNLFLKLDIILKAGGFDEHLASCTDRDLCLRLCELEDIRYTHIGELMLNHYADDDRMRLSTPRSKSKSSGLSYFWYKHSVRMTASQQTAFLKRAQSLFFWSPDDKPSAHQENNKLLDIERPTTTRSFTLIIGVISGDPEKLLPLLNSVAELSECNYLQGITTLVLCNGCSSTALEVLFKTATLSVGNVTIISEEQQRSDAENGLFGCDLSARPKGMLSIAHARCLLQKYVGHECLHADNAFSWILDDDMRVDMRAKQFLEWLPTYKEAGIDVLIGQYEGASPNPPLNGLRGQLVDLVHNLRWLDSLPDNMVLPNRSDENAKLRRQYPDYYYDLSRQHTAHLELPFWIEPESDGETIREVRARLFSCAPLLITGFPLTRAIISENFHKNPLTTAKDSVNRGGNTFVLNPKALLNSPNVIPKINGREARRSDMIWAMVNKYHFGLTVKTAPFPVLHTGRIQAEKTLNLEKVKDEIVGSALYAGLQAFLAKNPQHDLNFTEVEATWVCKQTRIASDKRLENLKLSFYRINGLAHALSRYPELNTLCEYINASFNINTYNQLKLEIEGINGEIIEDFLRKLISKVENFTA